jgi:hypothetical protein
LSTIRGSRFDAGELVGVVVGDALDRAADEALLLADLLALAVDFSDEDVGTWAEVGAVRPFG